MVVRKAPSRWIEMQLLPVGEGEVDQRLDDLDAGIADQHVDLAVFGDDVGGALFDRGLVGHVHRHREGVASAGLDLGCGRIGGVDVQVGDDGNAALGGKAQRDLLADAARGAGDDRNPSIETGHVFLPFRISLA